MKKFFSLVLLFMAIVLSANAEMTTLWSESYATGNWSGGSVAPEYFSSLRYGDKIVFSLACDTEAASADPNGVYYQYQVTANDYDNPDPNYRTPITSGDLQADGDVEVELTNEQVDLVKKYGLLINGRYVVFTKITAGTDEGEGGEGGGTVDEGETVTVWNGEPVAVGDWSRYVDLSYSNKPEAIGSAKIGDRITVTCVATGDDATLQIANPNGWVVFDSNSETKLNVSSAEQTFGYVIPGVSVLEAMQRDGILVRGKNITITKVEITTYPDSYDAASVVIGEAGVATYSNSSKALDFSATGVKAYYAGEVEVGKVTLESIDNVPAYTGVIVKGEPGTYEVPVIGAIDGLETNYLKAVGDWDSDIEPSAEGAFRYTLTDGVGFSLVSSKVTLPAHSAYLETALDITPAAGGIVLEYTDEPGTGIEGVSVETVKDDAYYNLQGMRVSHPVKGIYIHNGKKIVIK